MSALERREREVAALAAKAGSTSRTITGDHNKKTTQISGSGNTVSM